MRKEVYYTIDDENSRDHGKTFLIREMGAWQAEKWCYKALGAMIRGGLFLPDGWQDMPADFLAKFNMANLMRLDFIELEPLLDEIMGCIEFVVDKSKPQLNKKINPDIEQIQEPNTLLHLRTEAFKLHLGFLTAVLVQISATSEPGETQE